MFLFFFVITTHWTRLKKKNKEKNVSSLNFWRKKKIEGNKEKATIFYRVCYKLMKLYMTRHSYKIVSKIFLCFLPVLGWKKIEAHKINRVKHKPFRHDDDELSRQRKRKKSKGRYIICQGLFSNFFFSLLIFYLTYISTVRLLTNSYHSFKCHSVCRE